MIRTGQTIENPVTGEVLIFRKTARDTGGEYVLVETVLRPGATVAAAPLAPVPVGELPCARGPRRDEGRAREARARGRRERDRAPADGAQVLERRRRRDPLHLRGQAGGRFRAADRDDVQPCRRRQDEQEGDAEPDAARGDRPPPSPTTSACLSFRRRSSALPWPWEPRSAGCSATARPTKRA